MVSHEFMRCKQGVIIIYSLKRDKCLFNLYIVVLSFCILVNYIKEFC